MVRGRWPSAAIWLLPLLTAIVGCASVGVSQLPPSPHAEPFERGLMAYVAGELDQAQAELAQAIDANPYDRRAIDLLQAILHEKGGAWKRSTGDATLPLGERLSPEWLVRIVIGRNPEIRRAILRVVEARSGLREANVSFSPEFSLLTRFNPAGLLIGLTESIVAGTFKRRALLHQAEEAVLVAVAGYSKVRADVLGRALSAYLDLLEARDLIGFLEEDLKVRGEQVRVTRVLVRYGTRLAQDLFDTEGGMLEVRQELAAAKGRTAVARATLSGLMGRPVEEPLSVVKRRIDVEIPEGIRQAIAAAREKRPELEEALRKVEEAKAGRKVIARELPKVDLVSRYGAPLTEGGGEQGEFLEGLRFRTRLSIPILIWPLQKARSDRQEAFVRQLEMEVGRLLTAVSIDAVDAYEEASNAQTALGVARAQVAATREALRISQAVQQWGEGGERLSAFTARIRLGAARRQALTRGYDMQRAALKLKLAMGVLPERVRFAQSHEAELEDGSRRASQSSRPGRALWVWRPTFLDTPQDMEFFLAFAEARRIDAIFLFVSTRRLLDGGAVMRLFLRLAHARGLTVHALNGEPTWIFAGRRSGAAAFIEEVLRYNRRSPPAARFDAIHLDVEPHALPKWKAGRKEQLTSRYVAFLMWSRNLTREGSIPLVVDVPHWFDLIDVGPSTLFETVLGSVDQVAVMAYQGQAKKVIRVSATEVAQAEAKEKKIWIGLSADPAHLASGPAGRLLEAELERVALDVEEAFRGRRSLLGIAIHDYDRYRRLILGRPTLDKAATPPLYSIRIASFKTEAALAAHRAALERHRYRSHVVEVTIPGRGKWKRLYVGPFSSFEAAAAALKQMQAKGIGRHAIVERASPNSHAPEKN